MILKEHNGHFFAECPTYRELGAPSSIYVDNVEYTVLGFLTDISEELAAEIYPEKKVLTHTPSKSVFVRPVVNAPEYYNTHLQALTRHIEFNFFPKSINVIVAIKKAIEISESVKKVHDAISKFRFPLDNEKATQQGIFDALSRSGIPFDRERYLDPNNIIDFMTRDGVGIEVKIKGAKVAIYRQLERYAKFEFIKALILVSNVSMALPKEINGKPLYYIKLSHAYL